MVSQSVSIRNVANFPPSARCSLLEWSRELTFGGGGPRPTGGKPAGSAGGVGNLFTCRLRCAWGWVELWLMSRRQGSVGARVEGFVKVTGESGGSASPEDPPRTSLDKAHGPDGGT